MARVRFVHCISLSQLTWQRNREMHTRIPESGSRQQANKPSKIPGFPDPTEDLE
jgi:hypothetical protein